MVGKGHARTVIYFIGLYLTPSRLERHIRAKHGSLNHGQNSDSVLVHATHYILS